VKKTHRWGLFCKEKDTIKRHEIWKKKQQKQKDKKLFRKKCQNFFNKLIKILIGSDTTKKSNYGVRESK